MNNNLLDLFYDCIIQEAATGRVDCFFRYNLIFHTSILEENIHIIAKNDNPDLMIPTLNIQNRREFDSLLLEYVHKALDFYDDKDYYDEVKDSNFWDNELGISKEKLIMILLWSNATIEDFYDPCSYLRKRISFLEMSEFSDYFQPKVLGFSEVLGGNIEVTLLKSRIESETPYFFQIFLKDCDTGEKMYEFPRVFMGTFYHDGYIYAIQNSRNRVVDDFYSKKVGRKLYRIHEGFDVKEDTYDQYDMGNLKDVTPSFLVAANIVLGLFRSHGINFVYAPSILIERWNSKVLVLENKKERLKLKQKSEEEILNFSNDYEKQLLTIQSNLTEKFIRIFRRLDYHHSSIEIFNYPYEKSSMFILKLCDGEDICDNKLLRETYEVDFYDKVSLRKK